MVLSSSPLLYLFPLPSLIRDSYIVFISRFRSLRLYYFPLYHLLIPPLPHSHNGPFLLSWLWSYLLSLYIGYILTIGELDLGHSGEKKLATFYSWFWVTSLTKILSFPSISLQISFIFLYSGVLCIVHIYQILIFYLPVEGFFFFLGCFHLQDIVN